MISINQHQGNNNWQLFFFCFVFFCLFVCFFFGTNTKLSGTLISKCIAQEKGGFSYLIGIINLLTNRIIRQTEFVFKKKDLILLQNGYCLPEFKHSNWSLIVTQMNNQLQYFHNQAFFL